MSSDCPAFGIEQDLVPADQRHFVGGGGSGGEAAFEGGGRKEVEFGVDFSLAGRDFNVDGEAIEQIAPPLQGFAAGKELESGEVDDGAVGSVFAGDPLGVIKGQVSGAGGDA